MSEKAALVYRETEKEFHVVHLNNGGFVDPPFVFSAGRKLSIYYQSPDIAKELILLPQPDKSLQYLPRPSDVPPDFTEGIVAYDTECYPFVRRNLQSVIDWFLEECNDIGENEWSVQDIFLYDAYAEKNYWQWSHVDFYTNPDETENEAYAEYLREIKILQAVHFANDIEDGFVGLFPESVCGYLDALHVLVKDFYLDRPKLMKAYGESRKSVEADYAMVTSRIDDWISEYASPKGDISELYEYLKGTRENYGISDMLSDV